MIKPDIVYIASRTKKTKYLYEKYKSNKNSHPTNAVIEKNKDGKRNYKQD